MVDDGAGDSPTPRLRAPSLDLNAREPVLVPSWRSARDRSCAALLDGERLIIVTGPPGTGKTMLLYGIARVLGAAGWSFAKQIPDADVPQLEGGIPPGNAALLIDNADRLSRSELHSILQLRGCSVVLAGAVALTTRCSSGGRVTLAALTDDEVAVYVRFRLGQVGQSPNRLSKPSLLKLAEMSTGIPRVLSILLAKALQIADAAGRRQVLPVDVEIAAWHHLEEAAARRTGSLKPGHRESDRSDTG